MNIAFFIQILAINERLDEINKEKIIDFIVGLQQENESNSGDCWGIYK